MTVEEDVVGTLIEVKHDYRLKIGAQRRMVARLEKVIKLNRIMLSDQVSAEKGSDGKLRFHLYETRKAEIERRVGLGDLRIMEMEAELMGERAELDDLEAGHEYLSDLLLDALRAPKD